MMQGMSFQGRTSIFVRASRLSRGLLGSFRQRAQSRAGANCTSLATVISAASAQGASAKITSAYDQPASRMSRGRRVRNDYSLAGSGYLQTPTDASRHSASMEDVMQREMTRASYGGAQDGGSFGRSRYVAPATAEVMQVKAEVQEMRAQIAEVKREMRSSMSQVLTALKSLKPQSAAEDSDGPEVNPLFA